jgi:hypothetical protein
LGALLIRGFAYELRGFLEIAARRRIKKMNTKIVSAFAGLLIVALATGTTLAGSQDEINGNDYETINNAWMKQNDPSAYNFFTTSHETNVLALLDNAGLSGMANIGTIVELAKLIDEQKPEIFDDYAAKARVAKGPVDVTAEACKNENANEGASCTGSYSSSNDQYDYAFTFGDIQQTVCSGGLVQQNVIIGDDNTVCTAMAPQQICIDGSCTETGVDEKSTPRAFGITGVSAQVICFSCLESRSVEWLKDFDENAYNFFGISQVDQVLAMSSNQDVFGLVDLKVALELAESIDSQKPAMFAEYLAEVQRTQAPVEVTAEACKNENANEGATCTGSYTNSDDQYFYTFYFGDVQQTVCYGNFVQQNIVVGNTNTLCTAMAPQQICINGSCTGGELGRAKSIGLASEQLALDLTGVSEKAICFSCIQN